MEKLLVTVEIKSNYGREAIYPVNEAARHFARIAGTKTLSRANIETIKALGFTIKTKTQDL